MLDNLIAAGKAKPMIVVMPCLWMLPVPLAADQHGTNEALFARSLREEIVPFVDMQFRTLPGVQHRALAGLGDRREFLPTLVWQMLDMFGSIGSVSGGADAQRIAQLETLYPGVIDKPANIARVRFYLGNGTRDGSMTTARSLEVALLKLGYKVDFFTSDTVHGWPEFRYNFEQFMRTAFR